MLSLLAFDSNSIKTLLCDSNSGYFRSEFPIFYRTKCEMIVRSDNKLFLKNSISNPIDAAMENNQVRAIGIMIDHIVKYQNNFVSAFLFRHNIIELMGKGIEVNQLLNSNIFTYTFEFEEWPATHRNLQKVIVPYNNSIFNIRESYDELFRDRLELIDEEVDMRYYKIKYSLNLLPFIKSNGTQESFTQLCQEKKESELMIFQSQALKDLIIFKWESYAYFLHYLGAIMHFFYIFTMTLYIYQTYLIGIYGQQTSLVFTYLMMVGIIYPSTYDLI